MTDKTRTGRAVIGSERSFGTTSILRSAGTWTFIDPHTEVPAQRQRPGACVAACRSVVVVPAEQDEESRVRPDGHADPEEAQRTRRVSRGRIPRRPGERIGRAIGDTGAGHGEPVRGRR